MERPDHLIGRVIDGAFDPRRSDSENAECIRDALSQFEPPGDRDQDQALTFSMMDAIARRRGSVVEQAIGGASPGPDARGPAPVPSSSSPTEVRGQDGLAGWAGLSFGDALIMAVAEKQREHALSLAYGGDFAEAKRFLISSIDKFRVFGDTYGLYAAIWELGVVFALQGEAQVSSGRPDLAADAYTRAKELVQESLRLRYQAGVGVADEVRVNIANLAAATWRAAATLWPDDRETASWLYREALDTAGESGDTELVQEMQEKLRSYGIA